MTAIIDNDVECAESLVERAKKLPILLRTDDNLDTRLCKVPRPRLDVESDDRRMGTEIFLPHLEGSAMIDADLEHAHGRASEAGEVPMVHIEVVVALVDEPALIAEEVLTQRVRPDIRPRYQLKRLSPEAVQPPPYAVVIERKPRFRNSRLEVAMVDAFHDE